MSAFRSALLTAIICAVISGCGFKLRGETSLPFRTLYVAVPDTSTIGVALRRNIRDTGPTKIVKDPSQAEARLDFLGERRSTELLTINNAGSGVQYNVFLQITFKVSDSKGRDYIAPTQINLKRLLRNNSNAVLAQETEINSLYADMESDAVQQVLRRMEAIKVSPQVTTP